MTRAGSGAAAPVSRGFASALRKMARRFRIVGSITDETSLATATRSLLRDEVSELAEQVQTLTTPSGAPVRLVLAISRSASEARLAPGLLRKLVETVVESADLPASQPLTIVLGARLAGAWLEVGLEATTEPGAAMSLEHIHTCLRLVYGREGHLVATRTAGASFSVAIVVPAE